MKFVFYSVRSRKNILGKGIESHYNNEAEYEIRYEATKNQGRISGLAQYKKENGYNVRGLRINFERLLFISFIVTFILLIFVQAALMSPSVRIFMSVNNGYEGVPLGPEEYLYKEGRLELETSEAENAGELKILINGDEAAAFTSKNVSINVKDGDVVEIDGSTVQESVEVGITSKSANITSDCVGKRIKVKSNVKKLVKVKID